MKLKLLLLIGLLFTTTINAGDIPKIEINVIKDDVYLLVTSKVQFTVWKTSNLKSKIWWPMFTSQIPPANGTIVWFGYGNKVDLYPNYSFYKVLPSNEFPLW